MKWLFLLLLLTNIFYLGLEIERNSSIYYSEESNKIKIPADAKHLHLISEVNIHKLKPKIKNENIHNKPLNLSTKIIINNNKLELELAYKKEQPLLKNTCYAYGPFYADKELISLLKWLKKNNIKYKQRKINENNQEQLRVYLPPKKSREKTEIIISELKEKGIKDLHLIKDNDLLNAISLGVFSSQGAVNRRLKEIKAKGYNEVAVMPYNKKTIWLDIYISHGTNNIKEFIKNGGDKSKITLISCDDIAIH